MNNKLKVILIIVCIVVTIFVIYLTIDCIRLRNSKIGTKPFIIISKEVTANRITYYGLGYYIQYYTDIIETENNGIILRETKGYGAEFRLFNKILIWAWAE